MQVVIDSCHVSICIYICVHNIYIYSIYYQQTIFFFNLCFFCSEVVERVWRYCFVHTCVFDPCSWATYIGQFNFVPPCTTSVRLALQSTNRTNFSKVIAKQSGVQTNRLLETENLRDPNPSNSLLKQSVREKDVKFFSSFVCDSVRNQRVVSFQSHPNWNQAYNHPLSSCKKSQHFICKHICHYNYNYKILQNWKPWSICRHWVQRWAHRKSLHTPKPR